MRAELLDWGPLIENAVALGLAALTLWLLWRLLRLLLVLGPPTYAGIVVGHFIAGLTHDAIAGLLVAIVIAGLLGEIVSSACRWLGPASPGGPNSPPSCEPIPKQAVTDPSHAVQWL